MSYEKKSHSSGYYTSYGPGMKALLKEISSYNVISREDERKLFVEYRDASPSRKQQIKAAVVNANMRFVLKIALTYRNIPNVDVLDIVSEGKIGLLNAIELYKYETNNKFISFAVWHIRARVSKYLECNDLIRIPAQKKVNLNKAKKMMANKDLDDMNYMLNQITGNMASLDSMVGDGDLTLAEILADENVIEAEDNVLADELRQNLDEVFSYTLNEEEIAVIECLYGINRSEIGLKEAKEIIGKSHERIRQIRDGAFHKLRKVSVLKELKDISTVIRI